VRIVALLTIRNEELHLPRVLKHLADQGIEVCLIDNGSTDSSLEIAREYLGKGITRIEQLPYTGAFELWEILRHEERLAKEIDADWYIHHDADEIREAPSPTYTTLYEGIYNVDRMGYNAIDFDEFVFTPTSDEERFEGTDYVNEMRYYYFFQPGPLRRVNAWKNLRRRIDLVQWGGHQILFRGRKIYPEKFILRHYIVLSRTHAIRKFGERIYSKKDIARFGWFKNRAGFQIDHLNFPKRENLCCIDTDSWDRSNPHRDHLLFHRNIG
jgi:glycosyltransferase involved in cell wall biosynthesis